MSDGIEHAPQALKWFKVYSSTQAACAALLIFMSLLMMFLTPSPFSTLERAESRLTSFVALILALPLLGLFLRGLFLGRTWWSWAYSLLLIALGLLTCLMPVSVLLLIAWFKPETKQYYGMR